MDRSRLQESGQRIERTTLCVDFDRTAFCTDSGDRLESIDSHTGCGVEADITVRQRFSTFWNYDLRMVEGSTLPADSCPSRWLR